MKARQIADATREAILSGQYDFVRCNFANPGGRLGGQGGRGTEPCGVWRRDAAVTAAATAASAGHRWAAFALRNVPVSAAGCPRLLPRCLLHACRHGGAHWQAAGGHRGGDRNRRVHQGGHRPLEALRALMAGSRIGATGDSPPLPGSPAAWQLGVRPLVCRPPSLRSGGRRAPSGRPRRCCLMPWSRWGAVSCSPQTTAMQRTWCRCALSGSCAVGALRCQRLGCHACLCDRKGAGWHPAAPALCSPLGRMGAGRGQGGRPPAAWPALTSACCALARPPVQRQKSGAPVVGPEGRPLELTSHTLNPVPCAIGGPGLPPDVHFRCATCRPAVPAVLLSGLLCSLCA